MKRPLLEVLQRLLQSSLLFVLLLTLLISLPRQSVSQNSPVVAVCGRERAPVVVELDGCEPHTLHLQVCNGACISNDITQADPPYRNRHCTTCQPTRFRTKMRRFKTMCNGVLTDKKIFYSFVEECGCVNKSSQSTVNH